MTRFRPLQVLVVEDNPDDVEIARRGFARSKVACDLLVLRDGQEVLDALFAPPSSGQGPAPRPDFILLDIKLPKVDGLEVLKRLRDSEELSVIPVVMLTSSGRDEDVNTSYRLGVNSYIQKPVTFDRFLEALEVLGQYWFQVATLPRVPWRGMRADG